MKIGNPYYTLGFVAGNSNRDPAKFDQYNEEQAHAFWAGYRAGVRCQVNIDPYDMLAQQYSDQDYAWFEK